MSINADFQSFFTDIQGYAPLAQKASLIVRAADGTAHVSKDAASLKAINFKVHFADLAFSTCRPEGCKGLKELPEDLQKKVGSDTRKDLNTLRDRVNAMFNILSSKEEFDKTSSKTAYERLRRALNIEAARTGKPIAEADDNDDDEVVQNIQEKIAFCKALSGNLSLNSEELRPALHWYQRKFGEIQGHVISNGLALLAAACVAGSFAVNAAVKTYFNF